LRREAARAALPEADRIDSARLVDMAQRRLPGAAELLDRYARNVAVGIANLQQTVAPNIFILHGDVVLGGDRLLTAIADHVRAMVPSRPGGAIEFIAGDAGDRAALLGAAGLVISELLQLPI
jgi:predicted NBD/HSP70 family sugar kinase